MSFSINTNIASLQARNNLRINSDFQAKTIGRVTSGLRIVNSGDDAAGLAVANGFRSDQAVLNQGIRNANDGLAQLQTIDGGISNISQLLDRARTLATQSASGTFTGDRTVLNSEFQNVLSEINRQSQSIGLNTGGTFAKALQVFIGGGRGASTSAITANGSVGVDLSHSAVDAQALGLNGVVASGKAGTDIGSGSKNTSVAQIIADTNNTTATSGFTSFLFTGPGFSDTYGSGVVRVSVNLNGVADSTGLANALNGAIATAATGSSQQATAFKNANITASITTDVLGRQQLSFNSSSSAFQVQAGDKLSNALLGNFATPNSNADGLSVTASAAGATNVPGAAGVAETVKVRLTGAGVSGAAGDITVNIAGTEATQAAILADVQSGLAANSTLSNLGVTASIVNNKLTFTAQPGQSFRVAVAGDTSNFLGLGSFQASAGTSGAFDYTSFAALAGGTAAKTQGVQISVNGGTAVDLGVLTGSGAAGTDVSTLNAAIQNSAVLRAAGVVAVVNAGNVKLQSATDNIRVNLYSDGTANNGDAFGFGAATATSLSSPGAIATNYGQLNSVDSSGAYQSVSGASTDVYQFKGLTAVSDAQTVTVTAVDSTGAEHSLNIGLNSTNASTLDATLNHINAQIQQSNDSTLRSIAAFKEVNAGATAEGIRFLNSKAAFKISLGATADGNGISDAVGNQGVLYSAAANGAGGTADISNQSTASAAVTALAAAVATLGKSQGVIGQGENQFTFAVNLAQSQVSNLAASESQIRDADLAAESANLTKAQILVQAGVAALAQANSAPQQLISLLQGR